MLRTRAGLFFRFFKFLDPYRKIWILILLLSQAGVFLSLINPLLAKYTVDEALAKRDLRSFFLYAAIGAAVFIFSTAANAAKDLFERIIKTRVYYDLNKALFSHLEGLSLAWFKDKSTGEHIYRFDNDLNAVTDFLTGALPQGITIFPKILLIWVLLLFLNWHIALFALCLVPLYCLPPYYFSRKIERSYQDITGDSEAIFKELEENFSHIQLVKVFGKERRAVRRYLRRLIFNIRLRVKNIKLDIFSGLATEVTAKIIVGIITLYGGYQVVRGHLTLGTLTAIMVYFYQLAELQGYVTSFFMSTATGYVSCQRVASVLDERPQIVEQEGAVPADFKKGEIVFDHITFGYQKERIVLRGVGFSIPGGSHAALVGPSGCGKTTLLNFLVRLYDPQEGAVLIDGRDIKDLTLSSLKQEIGFVLQEPFLWNDSIENNILFGREQASREEVRKAAEEALVSEFVKDLPQGYATVIGEQACKISEGQKQKIAIARALLKKPKILVLDEAMASMDSASEIRIIANIKKSYPEMTVVVVSHRLSTVASADRVYYLAALDTVLADTAENLFRTSFDFAGLFAGQEEIFK